ncbi:MAG: rhodanese-like domain-containing protein [Acidimicrobiia bacterium]
MESLVTIGWLADHLDDPDLLVFDCSRFVDMTIGHEKSGRPAYDREHILGAAFLELQDDLSDPEAELTYSPLPIGALAAAFGRLGIGDETRVVLYDNSGSMWAAWAWWLLYSVGFDRAALLPSGVADWRDAGHPVTDQTTEYPPATLTPARRPGALADRDEVLAATEDPTVRIIDVLPPESYQGLFAMYDRPGHIASAVNEPMAAISGDGFSLKSTEEIESGLGGVPAERAISYCGGGIAAAASAFAMVRAGYTDVAIYPGSLEEWTKNPALPMLTGPDPT